MRGHKFWGSGYPDKMSVKQFKHAASGDVCWEVYYQPVKRNKPEFVGTIRRVQIANGAHVIVEYNHPPMKSFKECIWWLSERLKGKLTDRY